MLAYVEFAHHPPTNLESVNSLPGAGEAGPIIGVRPSCRSSILPRQSLAGAVLTQNIDRGG